MGSAISLVFRAMKENAIEKRQVDAILEKLSVVAVPLEKGVCWAVDRAE